MKNQIFLLFALMFILSQLGLNGNAQTVAPIPIDFSKIPPEFNVINCDIPNAPLPISGANCTGTSSPVFNFTPENTNLIKIFRLNFIFMQKDDGSGNFQSDQAEHQKILEDAIGILNWKYSSLDNFATGESCYENNNIGNTKIQFEVRKQYISNTEEWDNENDCNYFGCPDRDSWYLKSRNDQINSTATGNDIGLNIFFTENQFFYNLLVLGQGACPPQSYSHPCTTEPGGCPPGIVCSMYPSDNLDDFSSIHMRNVFTKYYTMKYLVAGSTQYPGTFFDSSIGWGIDGDGDGDLYDNVYWWMVSELAGPGLAHELGHSFNLSHTCKTNQCQNNNIMNGGSPSSCRGGGVNYLNAAQLTTIQRSVALTNIRKYVKDECTYNASSTTVNTNTTWDFDIQLYSNLDVTSSATLTNTCKIFMPCSTTLTIKSGAKFVIDQNSLLHLASNASVIIEGELLVKSGGILETTFGNHLRVKNGGKVTLEGGGKLLIENGATLFIERGGNVLIGQNAELISNNLIDNKGIVFGALPTSAIEPYVEIAGKFTTGPNAPLTFSGNGYFSFASTYILNLDPGTRLILEGESKDDLILELKAGTQFNFLGKELIMINGKVIYSSSSTITSDQAKVRLLSVRFSGGGDMDAVKITNVSNVSGLGVNINNCIFDNFQNGLSLQDNNNQINIQSTAFTNCFFSTVYMENCKNGFNSFSNLTIDGINRSSIGIKIKTSILSLHNSTFTNFNYGIGLESVPGLYLYNTSLSNNNYGIYSLSPPTASDKPSNVFLRNCSKIFGNQVGVFLNGRSTITTNLDYALLAVGDLGGAWIYNNQIGVSGSNVELHIDAELNACNTGNCDAVIPNRFDGNTTNIFQICYTSNSISQINAKRNFWGIMPNEQGGGPISIFPYNIKGSIRSNQCGIAINVNGAKYETQTPQSCDVSPCFNCPTTVKHDALMRLRSCQSPVDKKRPIEKPIGEQFEIAYKEFLQTNYREARSEFEKIVNIPKDHGANFEIVCRHLQRVAEILSEALCNHLVIDDNSTMGGGCNNPFVSQRKAKPIDEELNVTNIKEVENEITLIPNPGTTELLIHSPNDRKHFINITSVMGQTVFQSEVNGSLRIDLTQWPKGLYFVVTDFGNGSKGFSQKLIIQ